MVEMSRQPAETVVSFANRVLSEGELRGLRWMVGDAAIKPARLAPEGHRCGPTKAEADEVYYLLKNDGERALAAIAAEHRPGVQKWVQRQLEVVIIGAERLGMQL